MIKLLAVVKRRDEMSRDDLLRHWEHIHAPGVAERVQPNRYTLTFFERRLDGGESPYDGMASLWFDSLEHWQRASAPRPDAPSDGFADFLVADETFFLLTSEIVVVDGTVTAESEKTTFFVQRKESVTEADHFQHWRDQHIPNVREALKRNPGGLRYVVSQADLGQPGRYSGLAELYWQDADARTAFLPGVQDDGFVGLSEPYYGILGREITIVA